MQKADAILGLIGERGKKGLPLEQRVYRLLFNRDLYLMAYGKIYRNKGAMTHGVTDETPDGMSLAKIEAIIEALRYERFQWLPARRTSIPKKNGKKRPLGMPVWTDKLVQEVLRLILETYYDPQFSDHSHGFRPGRGPHTALREIYYNWRGTTWFIEGDISQCFDKLDKFVENVLIPQYTRGAKKKQNNEYHRLMDRSHRLWQKGNIEEAKKLRSKAQQLPSQMTDDPDYRRLNYVRYADDFILGFIGPKEEAEAIKQQLREFLREQLKLELSEEKTLITHARNEAAKFLGYEITMLHDDAQRAKRKTNGIGKETKCRSINQGIELRVPQGVVEEKCQRYKQGTEVLHRKELQEESDYAIVMTYQLEYRGIINYYQLARNIAHLGKLKWTMETSLTKTLASKHKMPVTKVYERYGAKLTTQGKARKVLQATVPREGQTPLVATWGGIPLKRDIQATLEERPQRHHGGQTELVQRLLADLCELCGSEKDVEVHHVRAMRKLHEYPGRPKPEWVMRMIALRRKTLLLCKRCHVAIEHGLPITWTTITLKEVKARRKARMTTILESRMP
jgi:retron-type reverse transcriptase